MHINYFTKNAYQGKNQAELSKVARQQGFTSNAMRLDLFLQMFEIENGHQALIDEIKKYLEKDGKVVLIDEYQSIYDLIDINPLGFYED